jgi:hypothetical protein
MDKIKNNKDFIMYYQIKKLTPEEQLKIYMECSKEELAKMLIELTRVMETVKQELLMIDD